MMTDETEAKRAGLTLLRTDSGSTSWTFVICQPPPAMLHVRTSKSGGLGLFAAKSFESGELLLRESWLVGMPLAASTRACAHCLRVCSFNPVTGSAGVACHAGCGVKYCSPSCSAAAWKQHHRLLCTAAAANQPSSGAVNPLDVFRKHARLAPSALQQKAEDVILAAEILATCVTWADGHDDRNHNASAKDDDDEVATAMRAARATLDASVSSRERASAGGRGPPVLPPPFQSLSSYCVVSAAQRQHGGSASEKAAACAKWVNDSYKLIAASPLGHHPRFRTLCPPPVYSHALGVLDRNAASTMALPASRLGGGGGGGGAAGGCGSGKKAPAAEGFGLYPLFSCTNHACAPNAVNAKGGREDGVAMLDNTLVLRACRRISKGEEICFDYLDSAHDAEEERRRAAGRVAEERSASQRQQLLRENFGFACACPACVR